MESDFIIYVGSWGLLNETVQLGMISDGTVTTKNDVSFVLNLSCRLDVKVFVFVVMKEFVTEKNFTIIRYTLHRIF